MSFKLTFNVTVFGDQMFIVAVRSYNNPKFGNESSPFSGFFRIINAPQH